MESSLAQLRAMEGVEHHIPSPEEALAERAQQLSTSLAVHSAHVGARVAHRIAGAVRVTVATREADVGRGAEGARPMLPPTRVR